MAVFEKYPKTTLTLLLIIFILLADMIAGTLLIPEDFNSYRTPDPHFHHTLVPMREARGKWGDRVYEVNTNSLGFRDRKARAVALKADQERILLMGDSFIEGVGVTWEESVAGILSNDLKHDGMEVLNGSAVSYSPRFYYLKTKYLLEEIRLEFDHLFVFIDNSDPLNEITYRNWQPYPDNSFKKLKHSLGRFLFSHSYLYHSIYGLILQNRRNPATEQWNRKLGAAGLDETELEDDRFISSMPLWSLNPEICNTLGKKGLELCKTNMDSLLRLCREHNIHVTIAVYPWPEIIMHGDVNNVQVRYWELYSEANDSGFLNLYPLFMRKDGAGNIINNYFILNDVHWNPQGNELIARYILQYIKGRFRQNESP